LRQHGGDRRSEEFQGSDATLNGRGATYLRARLERDRPDLVARLDAGEFRSPRAAAIEAGWVKVPTPEAQALPWTCLPHRPACAEE
jgi:hypothetical protein